MWPNNSTQYAPSGPDAQKPRAAGARRYAAFSKFNSILNEKQLRGGTGYIKGGYTCVCFTESPISKLSYILANPDLMDHLSAK